LLSVGIQLNIPLFANSYTTPDFTAAKVCVKLQFSIMGGNNLLTVGKGLIKATQRIHRG
jgi:hypothetical protein